MVTTLHGTDITLVGSHPTYKTAVEFSINNSDVVTRSFSKFKRRHITFIQYKKEIQVIYNFIDIDKYEMHIKQECKRIALAKLDERILTHVSNFRPVKRTEDVIRDF